MYIDSDTAARELRVLSGAGRKSEERRQELQRLANVLTDPDLSIKVTFEDVGSFARPAPADAPHDFEIHLRVKRLDQVETELPEWVWDRRVQVALLFHELGHIRYSDFERFGALQQRVDPPFQNVFRMCYNAAEDVVIESQLAAEFNLKEEFITLHDAFRQQQHEDQRRYIELFNDEPSNHFSYTLYEALSIGILSRGFGTDNRFEAILDSANTSYRIHGGRDDVVTDLSQEIDTYLREMLATSDGTERVDRAFEFFRSVRAGLSELSTVQTVRLQTESFRPVEAGEFVVSQAESADQLPSDPSLTGAGEDEAAPTDGSSDSNAEPGDDTRTESSTSPEVLDTDNESPLEREAKTVLDLIKNDELRTEEVGIADVAPEDGNLQRWEQARVAAQQLTADLRTALRRRRRSDMRGGYRTGQIDPQRLVGAVHGRSRIFQKREPGDQRDYSCLIVLDRSGSMRDDPIRAAEDATAQLVHALNGVGVDVSVLSVYDNAPWIELPFGGEPNRFAPNLTAGRVSGETPLSEVLSIARHRIDDGDGTKSFVIVVTDGQPNYPDEYTDILDRYTIDVYGVYIDGEPGQHGAFFDRVVYSQVDSIDRTLRELARHLMK